VELRVATQCGKDVSRLRLLKISDIISHDTNRALRKVNMSLISNQSRPGDRYSYSAAARGAVTEREPTSSIMDSII
jgi:hypothetical protein